MPKKKRVVQEKPERLAGATAYGKTLGAAIRAALSEPTARRDNKILTSWTDAELERLKAASERRSGEPLAVLVRNFTLAALDALGYE